MIDNKMISMVNLYYCKGVFVWRWNKVDKKLWIENGKENFFECVWLDEEKGK